MNHYSGAQLIKEPNEGNKLWISGQIFAHNINNLQNHKISAVCSVGSESFTFPSSIEHLYLQIEDTEDEDISKVFQQTFQFIENNKKTRNVLVHCIAGISRSATIVAYYLMRKYRWTVQQSLENIRQSRSFIRPNIGFYRQLKKVQIQMRQNFPRL